MILIKNNSCDMSDDKIEEIRYGLEVLYLNISKYIMLYFIAFLFNYVKESFLCNIIFAIIRLTACGLHAKNGIICLTCSFIIILGIPYISQIVNINFIFKILLCIILFIGFAKYAPADTEKKPIVNKNVRKKLKTKSCIIVILYSSFILFNEGYIANIMLLCMITELLTILPITYKLFNARYNNYLKYTI